ncbi:hypothetical protein ACN28S_02020 [Cystobacter fuscus]
MSPRAPWASSVSFQGRRIPRVALSRWRCIDSPKLLELFSA